MTTEQAPTTPNKPQQHMRDCFNPADVPYVYGILITLGPPEATWAADMTDEMEPTAVAESTDGCITVSCISGRWVLEIEYYGPRKGVAVERKTLDELHAIAVGGGTHIGDQNVRL